MRVVSWNLQHGIPDPKGPPDLARGIGPLRELRGDVHGLQELDRGRWRTGFAHQGRRLGQALGGRLLWARAKHRIWAAQGNALVVRGDILSSEVLTLPGPGERRVAILATVVVRGQQWSVATTHLSLTPAVAADQLQVTLDRLSDRPGPRVLMGDLNLRPERVAPVALTAGYEVLAGPDTINARTGLNRRLDHVLWQGPVVTRSGVTKMPLSDHLAVWADLSWARLDPQSGRLGAGVARGGLLVPPTWCG